jgi:hypothetical protein
MHGGPRKKISECTLYEIKTLLIAGSVISTIIFVVTFFTRQPLIFMWFIRGFTLVWLVSLWIRCFLELKKRREARPTG